MSRNIEMNYKIDSGYEVLYPQVQMNNIISWNNYVYSKSQIDSTVSGLNSSIDGKANQSDLIELQDLVESIENSLIMKGNCTIDGGNYIGTGGQEGEITFSLRPRIIIIQGPYETGIWISNNTGFWFKTPGSSGRYCNTYWNMYTIVWESGGSSYTGNALSELYYYQYLY